MVFGGRSELFSDDGKYLLLTSSRDFSPIFGNDDFAEVYRDMNRVYLVTLAKETENPLGPRSDEVGKGDKKDKDKDEKKGDDKKSGEKKEEKKPVPTKVDIDGIQNRLIALEIPRGDYSNLRMVGDRIFYQRRTVADESGDDEEDGPGGDQKTHLCSYSLEDRKETALGDVNGYEITADGKKMLVKVKDDYAIIDLPKDKIELKDEKAGKDYKLKLKGLDMQLDRHAQWTQIYNEAWRQMRDFFYAPNMNGVDWKAVHDKYAALVPFVNHRNDLTYLLGEMIGELNNGHAYVGGGERPETPRIKLGLLGAEFSRDPASKAYRIDRILPGENWDKHTRSPLTEVGVNVKVGDYILAINGTPVASLPNLYDALIGTADKQVILRVNAKPSEDGARDVTVVPTADESALYYLAWVHKNIEDVAKKTNGEVAYLHIPDMGQAGLEPIHQALLPAGAQEGAHHRRARERRRVRLAADHREIAARIGHGRDRAQRHAADQSAKHVPRSDGHVDQRILRLRWRHLPLPFQGERDGQIDRQTDVGWGGWDSQSAAAGGWRTAFPAGIRALLEGRKRMADREPRRRSRYRGR